ncbi:histidine ammonia-lyase [Ascidiimonas aurantiaca]|uniref:histidine ammonia-lyase n=1 Tax=Ascidiimonas aurantiaca TaxID=1685432 RepID=UPI0030EEAC35
MKKTHYVSSDILDLTEIHDILINDKLLDLSEEARHNIEKCRKFLDKKLQTDQKPVYGINTGFGSLCKVKISPKHLITLQENLVMSHACGAGAPVPVDIVRLMLLLKIQSLSYGHSGVQLVTVKRLMDFYNHKVTPVVYTQGSLGASGDLAPLAHMALPLLGKGEVFYKGEKRPSEEVLAEMGWSPVELQSKEGLALLNGTQFMSAYGIYLLLKGYRLSYMADLIASISIDAFLCTTEPFDERIHFIRPHRGQVKTASRIRDFLKGSELAAQTKKQVQDPYSFRCVPQVHGATKDVIKHVHKVFKTEINSVTDNPNIFVEEDSILSGGNFHGQPLAMALDYLCIALAELGNISERRTYQLISGERKLPAFLVNDPGLNSGLMIPQYTAAGIVSENKQLCTPCSVDSITSSNGQEDHVSMGANAATKAYRVLMNLERILAIELLTASQAMFFRKPLKTSSFLQQFLKEYRKLVDFVDHDRILYKDIEASVLFISSYAPSKLFLSDLPE